MACLPCEEVPRLWDKESLPLWIQTPRPLKEVCFGFTGMLKSDTSYHNIGFCALDEEDTTGTRWAKSKPQSYWVPKRSEMTRTAGVTVLF